MAYVKKGKRNAADRLRSKLVINRGTECWEYRGYVTKAGYGSFSLDGKSSLAHRSAYLLFTGHALAVDEVIRHLCHNKICCNPEHLAPGSNADNSKDSVAIGSARNGAQRLSKADYEGILSSKLSNRQTGLLFGCSKKHVSRIRCGLIKIANDPSRWYRQTHSLQKSCRTSGQVEAPECE